MLGHFPTKILAQHRHNGKLKKKRTWKNKVLTYALFAGTHITNIHSGVWVKKGIWCQLVDRHYQSNASQKDSQANTHPVRQRVSAQQWNNSDGTLVEETSFSRCDRRT